MSYTKILPTLLVALTFSLFSYAASAQERPRISELTPTDRQYMEQQVSALDDLARRHLGSQFQGRKDHDIRLLQRLLDDQRVRSNQVKELQAMGAVLGKLLATDLGLQWVIYEDKLGRSRALRYQDSDNYLFPMTLVSRLRSAGNLKPVADIYADAYASMDAVREPLPFQ